ncbi:MAG: rod shape-determining protein MreC [Bacteroidia bacterium]|nr:rod shape-determining protein MreC [Bacteroidia bacterium]MCO5253796.1 rod shape-determining protein MreC [Bacteroidota bacterium]
MGSVIQFIKTYLHLILFVVFQAFSITLVVRFHALYQIFFFNTSNSITGNIKSFFNNINEYRNLRDVNRSLVNENLYLRGFLKENFYMQTKDTFYINDTLYKQHYVYVPASVIGNSVDKENNFLTLNKGKSAGIEKGMGVFGPDGIVGVVEDVSDNFCLVMSILNARAIVSPKIKELNLSQGKLIWGNRSPYYAYLEGINRYEKVHAGQRVVTSPYSKNFPENIPIGVIEDVKEIDGSFLKAKVRLSTSFSQLREVYIVKDLFKAEFEKFNKQIESQN